VLRLYAAAAACSQYHGLLLLLLLLLPLLLLPLLLLPLLLLPLLLEVPAAGPLASCSLLQPDMPTQACTGLHLQLLTHQHLLH
jgi:hypothetical protein